MVALCCVANIVRCAPANPKALSECGANVGAIELLGDAADIGGQGACRIQQGLDP